MKFTYVYILQSLAVDQKFYVGISEDLTTRLHKHNKGDVSSTRTFAPWIIKNTIAFNDSLKARNFERYLKTHSGRTWAKKHF